MKDLFDCLEEQPQELQNLFSKIEELSYTECENLLKKVEKLGYTFDYGLDSQPHSLRKIQTKRDKILEQIELQETIIAKANINIVNCGHCGSVFLHEINEEYEIQCPFCLREMDKSDCPDYLYSGIENNAEFEETPVNEWKCTDCDNEQYGRQISERVFEFKEKNRGLSDYEEDEFIEMTINLDHYTNEQIENHISAYYDSMKQLKQIYEDFSNWIIAECIFEQESGLY